MLTTTEILKRVRRIEIKTKGLSNHIFAGAYHSAFKGRGMSFSEVREYSYGDDIKAIDWNVTARFSSPYVKIFEEERELTVMVLIDISASSIFGSSQRNKRELITELCAVLAFSANTNNDKVGVILFSDKVELFIPPQKGKSHILRIIRELVTFEPRKISGTKVKTALEFLNQTIKKRCVAFLISDLVSEPYDSALQISARKHDLVGIQVYDAMDRVLPKVGLIQLFDAETQSLKWVDTNSKKLRQDYTNSFDTHGLYAEQTFLKSGAALMKVRTDEDYVKLLQGLFNKR